MIKDIKNRAWIYGTNFAVGTVSRIGGGFLGNPLGAVVFGALDIAGACSKKIKYGAVARYAKAAGSIYYGLLYTLPDFISIAGGNFGSIPDLAFDGSLAYLQIKDAMEIYSNPEFDLADDIKSCVNGVRGFGEKLINFGKRLKKSKSLEDNVNNKNSNTDLETKLAEWDI